MKKVRQSRNRDGDICKRGSRRILEVRICHEEKFTAAFL